jgi:hypothetical protein
MSVQVSDSVERMHPPEFHCSAHQVMTDKTAQHFAEAREMTQWTAIFHDVRATLWAILECLLAKTADYKKHILTFDSR